MDHNVIKQMILSYLEEKIVELQDALTTENFQAIKDIGHKIKGNSGSLALGLNEINDYGKILETNGSSQILTPCQEAVEGLRKEIEKLKS